MFNSDLLEVLLPVVVEPEFLLSVAVEFLKDAHHRHVKALSKRVVVFVSGLHDLLVVVCVLHAHLRVNFVFFHIGRLLLRGGRRSRVGRLGVRFRRQLAEINFEGASAEARERSHLSSRQVLVSLHGDQMLNVLVLFLDNFVARQLNEVLFVDDVVVEQDQSAHVVQVGTVELEGVVLLNVKQTHLDIVNQLYRYGLQEFLTYVFEIV